MGWGWGHFMYPALHQTASLYNVGIRQVSSGNSPNWWQNNYLAFKVAYSTEGFLISNITSLFIMENFILNALSFFKKYFKWYIAIASKCALLYVISFSLIKKNCLKHQRSIFFLHRVGRYSEAMPFDTSIIQEGGIQYLIV